MTLFYLHKEALLLLQGLGKKWLMPSLQVVIVLLAICGLLTACEQVFDWRCPERLDIGFPNKSGVCLLLNLTSFAISEGSKYLVAGLGQVQVLCHYYTESSV